MKVVITGGNGFLGQVLAKEILSKGCLRSKSLTGIKVAEVILADISTAEPKDWLFDLQALAESNNIALRSEVGDVSDMSYCKSIIGSPSDAEAALSVFHLGAVMSGAPPDLALKVNLHGTINMLEATRAWQESAPGSRPTFMFSSAGATLGAGHEADWVSKTDTISDATRAAPHTTYGTTKACAELLLADYSRREFVDGRGVRLPSVIVRAGAPNAATTSCFSAVVREPLSGQDAIMPIGGDVYHAITGYRQAIGGIIAVHEAIPDEVDKLLGFDRTVFLPTRSVCLNELEKAMKQVVTPESISKLGNIIYEEDERLSSIVGSFPTKVDSKRSIALGAPEVPAIDDIIREYCQDFSGALADGVVLQKEAVATTNVTDENHVVALITGGGSGIGRAVAKRLAKGLWGGNDGSGRDSEGNSLKVALVLAGRRPSPLNETKAMCEEVASEAGISIDVVCCPTDVTKERDVEMLMDTIASRFSRLDLLFNNAGINIGPASVETIESSDFQRVLDTNVTACWRMAKAAMQLMATQQPQGGRIINNGSISAYSPRPGSAPYTASKHAVLGLTKCIALDGRACNVACGQIDFGNVSSDMTKSVGGSKFSMSSGMPQANGTIIPEPTFSVDDAANTVFAMANLPLGANVLNMTVMATNMPYVGRG
jgi:NAD(P)-dependent dehydrogenase (short-subunit alcohol dehydrogenase family)